MRRRADRDRGGVRGSGRRTDRGVAALHHRSLRAAERDDLAHVSFGLSFSEIGRGFGRDRTTAAHACRLIEDRRDDPAVDAVLAQLEHACSALRPRMNPAVLP